MTEAARFPKGPAIIVFADLVGSSEIAEYESLDLYAQTVREFHEVARGINERVWKDSTCASMEPASPGPPFVHKRVISPRGDEMCFITSYLLDDYSDFNLAHVFTGGYDRWVTRGLLAAIKFALSLKAAWLLSPYNLEHRLLRGRQPLNLAVGIHLGGVALTASPSEAEPQVSDFLGHAINIAKRIEGAARSGRWTSVLISPEVRYVAWHALPDVICLPLPAVELQVPMGPIPLSEIREILFSRHYVPSEWQISLPGGLDVKGVADALTTLVGSRPEDLGLAFVAAHALACCPGMEKAGGPLTERLLQGVISDALRYERDGLLQVCYHRILPHYESLREIPKVEQIMSRCARAFDTRDFGAAAPHRLRVSARRTEYYQDGEWTKEVAG